MVEGLLCAVLLVAAIEDAQHYTISNRWVVLVLILSLLRVVVGDYCLVTLLIGLIGVGGLMLIGAVLTDSMGGGDVKLCAAIGGFYGVETAFLLIFLSLLSMIVVSKCRRVEQSPFAPFLLVGFFIYKTTQYLM